MTGKGTDPSTGGGILRTRPRYSSSTSTATTVDEYNKSKYDNSQGSNSVAVADTDTTIEILSHPKTKIRTLADLVSSSAGLSLEARGINQGGNVISHKQFIPKSIGQAQPGEGDDDNQLSPSLKSTLLISDDGIPCIKDLSESEPSIVDANPVIALGVMGEDGQQVVRFCEYEDDSENAVDCALSSKDRLRQRINSEFDEDNAKNTAEDDNSDSVGSSSLGSVPDEEILHELGLSELILDDDDDDYSGEDEEPRITIESKNIRSFRILWELLSRWATPATVELVLRYQEKYATPSPDYDESSSNPPSVQHMEEISSDCSRNIINIGASRLASITSMLNMQIPRSLIEFRNLQRGNKNSFIDQRMVEQRLANLVRTFDPSAPAADLNMKLWKGLTTILICIVFPVELSSSKMDECDDLLPLSIRRLNMTSAEYHYLIRSVFTCLSGVEIN